MPLHGADEDENMLPWYMILFYLCCKLGSMIPFLLGLLNHFLICGSDDTGSESSRTNAALAIQLWYFPSIPGAIIGLWLFLDVKIFRLSRRWSWMICLCCLGLGAVLLFAACYAATKHSGNDFEVATLLPFGLYVFMCYSGGATGKWKSFWPCVYSIFARNLPIASIAFGWTYTELPWTELQTASFGVCFLLVGAVCAWFAWYAFAMDGGPIELLKEREHDREMKREVIAAEEGIVSSPEEGAATGDYQPVHGSEMLEV